MQLDPDVCYRALRTRDARFDGQFFTAVRSTGVYCRPICPAPTPKRANCSFVPSAAAAQDRGFRPCLRCRPEASPGTPAWLGTSTTVSRALRLIAQGALDGDSVDGLAARLGVGARHLRRLFLQHVGATPISVAQTRRVLFAKKLIDETRLPFAEIALASGYSSIRRFNDAIRKTYERTPRELRRGRAADLEVDGSELTLRLSFRPPFQWEALLAFLDARATPGIEAVAQDAYARTFEVDGVHGWVEVRRVPGADRLSARIHLGSSAALIHVNERLRAVFDLDADPEAIGRNLSPDPLLGPTVRALPGVRIPGAWDAFELAVRAILGQQISVRGATTLAGRLVAAHGEKLAGCPAGRPRGLHSLFPTPGALARAEVAHIGLPRARAHSIRALATAIAAGELVLDTAAGLDATVRKLRALPGIGEWTAHYVAMRALREPDAFPASDLGLRRAAAANGERPTAAELAVRAETWRPWRAYAAMYLWLSPAIREEKRT